MRVEPLPIQYDPRFGMAWAPNPKTVLRVATGLFHDAIVYSAVSLTIDRERRTGQPGRPRRPYR